MLDASPGPDAYGEAFADVYDEWYGDDPETSACVDQLAQWAGAGPALELGVGTGRLALALAARGVDVRGIEASPGMVNRLRAKPGGASLPVALGDLATVEPPVGGAGAYTLVYASYNTFFNLPDDAAQRRCLARCRRWLQPGGVLALEAFVPDLDPAAMGRRVVHRTQADGEVVWSEATLDADAQVLAGRFMHGPGGDRVRPWRIRYLWPEQLDARASAAGLQRAGRWSDWHGSPFGPGSGRHVSWYRAEA